MLSLSAVLFEEDMVNVTPTLLRFIGKFFAVFAIVAVVGIVTPWLAKKIDALRQKNGKTAVPEDGRMKAVKGIYDAQEPEEAAGADAESVSDASDDETE